jgi:SAM-dependent methyltransferase
MPPATQAVIKPANPGATPPTADLVALKGRQQASWSSGDYAVVGTTLQIVGEELCEALDLRAGQKVLDVAAGNGNVTLAAARRWCEVTSTDYVPSLLEGGRARASAEGLKIAFKEADAEALPFDDGAFDAVEPPSNCCAFASRAAKSVSQTGRRMALSDNCSRSWANTCRRPRALNRLRSGEHARVLMKYFVPVPARSGQSPAISTSVTGRLSISSRCSRPTTVRCSRHSPRSMRPVRTACATT